MQNQTLPKDPMILLSFVNTQLRDYYDSLEEFAGVYGCDMEEIKETLKEWDYEYNPEQNQFI